MRQLSTRLFKILLSQRVLRKSGSYRSGGGGVRGSALLRPRASSWLAMGVSRPPAAMPVGRPAFLVPRFFAVGDGSFAASGRDAGRKTGVPGPALLRGGRWEVRDLRPRCRSEDRRSWSRLRDGRFATCGRDAGRKTGASWSRASSRWAMGGSRPAAAMPVGRPAFLVPRFFAVGDGRFATSEDRRSAAMPVATCGRPALLVPRFFAVGDGRFATSGRPRCRSSKVRDRRDPGPALLRGGRWEVRDLRPRCRSEDRRSWSRASSRWAMGGSRPPAAMPVGRPALLVPRFFAVGAVGDGRFATSGRDAAEDRRSWFRASSRWADGRFATCGRDAPSERPAFLVPRFFAVGDGRFAASGRDASEDGRDAGLEDRRSPGSRQRSWPSSGRFLGCVVSLSPAAPPWWRGSPLSGRPRTRLWSSITPTPPCTGTRRPARPPTPDADTGSLWRSAN